MVYYRNVYGCKPSDYNDGFLSIFVKVYDYKHDWWFSGIICNSHGL